MPQIIRHIDAIARAKQRDVLLVIFHEQLGLDTDWENLPIRTALIQWLDAHKIAWESCGEYADPDIMCCYLGQIYIDVPFDDANPDYQKLRDFLEYPDGTMRHQGMKFCYDSLAHAMENAHHDEPGFWENWAETF
jgi:hypothetical protein